MVKDPTTWKVWLWAPANFWVSLLVSSAVIHLMTSLTRATEIQETNTSSLLPQQKDAVAPSPGNFSSFRDVTSHLGKSNPQKIPASFPRVEEASLDTSPTELTRDNLHSKTEFTSNQKNSDTQAIPATTNLETTPVISEAPNLDDIPSDQPISQLTNVTQLRDVSPGDWAYEALRSLVERYGCIAGYPDRTFRGNRATSRYEFAAGLNACLQQIERLITSNTANFVSRKDLETLSRLTQDFQTELASLGPRIGKLENRVGLLEDRQFSTTTKLNGLAWFNMTGAFSGGDVKVETTNLTGLFGDLALRQAGRDPITNKPIIQTVKDNPNITLSNLVWLTFQTSFTGKDSLVTQLASGNGNSPANVFASAGLYNTFGVPYTDQSAGLNTGVNSVVLRELSYRFPVSKNLQVVVGPRINWYRYFDNNAYTFFLTGAGSFNSGGSTLLNTVDRGAGAAILWDINKQFKLRVAYLGESIEYLPNSLFNSASNPSQGLFNGTNTLTTELTFSPSDAINLGFLYNRSNIKQIGGRIGGAISEPIVGIADDGFGGDLRSATADTFAVNFDWRIASRVGIFGRYSYGSTHLTPVNPIRQSGDLNAQSFQLGVAFPDLGKKGALATVSYLIPFSILDGRKFLISGGGNGGTQYELEANYFYPLTRNMAIVPAFYLIANPNNFSNNPTIYVGNLRAQFSF